MTDPVDLDVLDALYEKATDGEWVVTSEYVTTVHGPRPIRYDLDTEPRTSPYRGPIAEGVHENDVEYIAALHNAYPALARELRELRAENAKAKRARGRE